MNIYIIRLNICITTHTSVMKRHPNAKEGIIVFLLTLNVFDLWTKVRKTKWYRVEWQWRDWLIRCFFHKRKKESLSSYSLCTSPTYPWSWSTLPDWEMQDRLEMVLAPSTMVALPDISPGLVRGPGSIMSPEITGRESGTGKLREKYLIINYLIITRFWRGKVWVRIISGCNHRVVWAACRVQRLVIAGQ